MRHAIFLSMLATAMLAAAGIAGAEASTGFDPAPLASAPLSEAATKALLTDAMRVRPPRNGNHYVIGFANLERDIAFAKLVEASIELAARRAGVELLVADNRLDGPRAIANARTFLAAGVDYAIEFQTDIKYGPDVMGVLKDGNIATTAIDIPMPGATFFGVNNPKMGYMGGSYLAQASIAKFGNKVASGFLVVGTLPQSGVVPTLRTEAQKAGFLDCIDGFPTDHVILIDTKNTHEQSYMQMQAVLRSIPAGAPIMVTAINDQAALGMLQAIKEAGREDDAVAVGNGADEAASLASEPALVAATGSFPDRYGEFLIPIALASLAGKTIPAAVFMTHEMVTKANLCQFKPDFPCVGAPPISYTFPQAKFVLYLQTLAGRRDLKGYGALIPRE